MTPNQKYGQIATDEKSCFLCGETTELITEEHVFAKWLQSRYNLWNLKLELLNGSLIRYKQLKIPCCGNCNNGDLSVLETTISRAVTNGYESAKLIDHRLWYLWLGKIYFGILRKELNLSRERNSPSAGKILDENTLRSFESLHLFLQGIRGKHKFADKPPYSVLICNLHDLGGGYSYSFRDSLAYMTISIRMGDVGVIVCFEDDGLANGSYGRYVHAVNHRKLHPIQFDELFARVTYQTSRIDTPVRFVTQFDLNGIGSARTEVLGGLYIHEHSNKDLSFFLSHHLSKWVRSPDDNEIKWYIAPDHVPTWMTELDGNLILKSLSEWEAETKLKKT